MKKVDPVSSVKESAVRWCRRLYSGDMGWSAEFPTNDRGQPHTRRVIFRLNSWQLLVSKTKAGLGSIPVGDDFRFGLGSYLLAMR